MGIRLKGGLLAVPLLTLVGCTGISGIDDYVFDIDDAGAGTGGTGGNATGGAGGHTGGTGGSGGSPDTPPLTVLVAGGTFTMGCTTSLLCETDHQPAHEVTLGAFEITKTEITQHQYDLCVEATVCSPPSGAYDPDGTPQHPVVNVSWTQADTYCSWVTGRLPTEAQWERAARGADGRNYPWGNNSPVCELANCLDCNSSTQPVGSYLSGASPYDALDMGGNVWEWVNDWYGHDYYSTTQVPDPQGPATGTSRVFRGGAYDSPADDLYVFEREKWPPSTQEPVLGFRCVLAGQ